MRAAAGGRRKRTRSSRVTAGGATPCSRGRRAPRRKLVRRSGGPVNESSTQTLAARPAGKAMRTRPGEPYPLGATWDGIGVNFALNSEKTESVELCLFDSADAKKESKRIALTEQTDRVWHAYLLDVLPGQLYGYRVHG